MLKEHAVAVVAVLLASAFVGSVKADNTTSATQTENTTVTTTQENSVKTKTATDVKWTELRGKVQHVDLTSNIVQIKEKGSDKLVEVPVDASVSVQDTSNHALSIGDLKEGQKVIIRHTGSNPR